MAERIRGITVELGADTTGISKALSGVNKNIKSTASQLKDVERLLKLDPSNVELLRQKQKLLNDAVAESNTKLKTLYDAEAKLKEAGVDENSEQFMALKREIVATQTAMQSYADEAKDGAEATKAAGDAAESANSKHEKLSAGLSVAKAAFVAMAAAAIKSAKEIVNAYADFEQLEGGIETLFGTSSGDLISNAANAYRTVGISANEYMQTATSFSAALIKSLGDDTIKAVNYTDLALQDMADNANKFGTDMSSIQNAYQGFAKENYTMLDNLKLGFAGTKEGMQELIAEAAKLNGNVVADDMGFANVILAIHTIQDELGVTGTTAAEAADTITGSINAAKASFDNLLVGIGDTDADLQQLTDNFMASVGNVIKNIAPIINNIINALFDNLDSIASALINFIISLLDKVAESVPQWLPKLVDAICTIIDKLSEPATLMKLAQSAIKVVWEVLKVVATSLPNLLTSILKSAFNTSTWTATGNLPMMANGGVLTNGSAIVGERGAELLTNVGGKSIVTPLNGSTGGSTGETVVNVNFNGSLSQLAAVLQPYITAETVRKGGTFA